MAIYNFYDVYFGTPSGDIEYFCRTYYDFDFFNNSFFFKFKFFYYSDPFYYNPFPCIIRFEYFVLNIIRLLSQDIFSRCEWTNEFSSFHEWYTNMFFDGAVWYHYKFGILLNVVDVVNVLIHIYIVLLDFINLKNMNSCIE